MAPVRNPPERRLKRPLERIGLLVLGAALALVGERLLLSRSGDDPSSIASGSAGREVLRARQMELAEDRMRTDLRLALAGFLRLADFRDFARRGLEATVLVQVAGTAERGEVIGAAGTRGVRVPRIVVDADARREWAELGRRLEGAEEGVDSRVFEAFQAVRAFVAEHPLPDGTDLAGAARSEWSRPTVVERWDALNRTLASRVVAVLSQLDAGP